MVGTTVVTTTAAKQLAGRAGRHDGRALETLLRALSRGEPYATYAGSPVSAVLPEAIGQMLRDTTNNVWYRATGLTSADWDTDIGGAGAQTITGAKTFAFGAFLRSAGNVTAAGSVQGNATAIAHAIEWVLGADATKGVILPVAVAGQTIILKNDDTANAVLKVYPAGNATINAIAAAGAISLAAKVSCHFSCYTGGDAGKWFTTSLLPS